MPGKPPARLYEKMKPVPTDVECWVIYRLFYLRLSLDS